MRKGKHLFAVVAGLLCFLLAAHAAPLASAADSGQLRQVALDVPACT
jgi:hypothetical protein